MTDPPAAQPPSRRRRWHTAVALLGAALALTGCQPCSGDLLLDSLEHGHPALAHIFVGTVVDSTWTASLVEVEEVWFGPDLAREVWLRGGLIPHSPLGDGERLVIGVKDGGRLRAGPCYVLEPDHPDMEGLRPDTVRSPIADGENGDPPLSTRVPDPRPYARAMLLVFIAIAVSIVVRNRSGDHRPGA